MHLVGTTTCFHWRGLEETSFLPMKESEAVAAYLLMDVAEELGQPIGILIINGVHDRTKVELGNRSER